MQKKITSLLVLVFAVCTNLSAYAQVWAFDDPDGTPVLSENNEFNFVPTTCMLVDVTGKLSPRGDLSTRSNNNKVLTSNSISGLAGVTLSCLGQFDQAQGGLRTTAPKDYSLVIKPSKTNVAEDVVLNAPANYVIVGYDIEFYTYNDNYPYSIQTPAETELTQLPTGKGLHTSKVRGLETTSTSFSIYLDASSVASGAWLGISSFVVYLRPVLPEDGKVYNIEFITLDSEGQESTTWGLASTGTLVTRNNGVGSSFVAYKYTNNRGEDRFIFVNNDDGCYLAYNNAVQTYAYNNSNVEFSVGNLSGFTANMASTVTNEQKTMRAYLKCDSRAAGGSNASYYVIASGGGESATTAPFFNESYTSAIRFLPVEEEISNKAALAIAKFRSLYSAKPYINYPLGDALGQYSTNFGAANCSTFAEFENLVNAATSVADLEKYVFTKAINQPIIGKFYRFKSATNGSRRMTSTLDENDKMLIDTNGSNAAPTVFYLDEEHHLVALSNGLCVGKFASDDLDTWKCILASNKNKVGIVEFKESSVIGRYNICMSNGRYLYNETLNGVDNVNCGNNEGDNGYRWDIEEVTWLPVPINTEVSYGTLYSPVELIRSHGRVKAYTGVINGDYITLNEITGNIPANTPVVIELTEGAETEDGCVYLQIASTDAASTAATSDNDNCFTGEVLAENYTPGNGICTLQKIDEEVGFYGYNGDTLYGFKAYLPAQESVVRGYAIKFGGEATGIDGIEAEKNASEIFYDLNGRRVLYPAAGIYVTASGKKVLVK